MLIYAISKNFTELFYGYTDLPELYRNRLIEQDKSSDIEQQPPFGDRKISNIQPQNRGSKKPTGAS